MAPQTWKMHYMAASHFMQLRGRSNSCSQTVSKKHTYTYSCSNRKCGIEHCPTCFLSAAVIEPFPSREATEEYLSRYVNPTLLRGLTELCKHKPHNPCVSTQSSVFWDIQIDRLIHFIIYYLLPLILLLSSCLLVFHLGSLKHHSPLSCTFCLQ